MKPGCDDAYRAVEDHTARLCVTLACPHPFLGIESLTGPKEVWFFNGYDSSAEQQQVVDDYAANTALMEALLENGKRKAALTHEPIDVVTTYRPDLTRGVPWTLGRGRFLVITVTTSGRPTGGTVFEATDGTRFIVRATEGRAAVGRRDANVFAVRPNWSFPADDWIAADPTFWSANPRTLEPRTLER